MQLRHFIRPAVALSLSAAALAVALTVPANDVVQFHAGQYVEFILRDALWRAGRLRRPETDTSDEAETEG